MTPPTNARPPSQALLDDLVMMTRQAAIDGLALAAVFDDVRLVLDLEPSDEVSAELLRTCALAWAEAHQELSAAGNRGVACETRADFEDHLWGLLTDPNAPALTLVLVVTADRTNALLRDTDALLVATRDLQAVFDRPGERVALVLPAGPSERDRVVVLAQSDDGRVARSRSQLRALEMTIHSLDHHPDGSLAALRRVLDEH